MSDSEICDPNRGQDPCQIFWNNIEDKTGSHLPLYVRNILKYNGFNCAMSMKLLEEDDLIAIEATVKSNA
ncbi:hypothetical protein Bhyg_08000, partial [Pseudolycoriella hygida]